jgi:hypothetical protein
MIHGKIDNNEWHRNGKGDKPRTKTWERKYQDNYDDIDWDSYKRVAKERDKNEDNDS